jgi:tetratricopeptide (TPR) repeat protein
MTDYNKWDKKASDLVKEAEEADVAEKADADKALGLEDGPKGPATAKAEKEIEELNDKSEKRKEFIEWQKSMHNEVEFTHKPQEAPLEFGATDVDGKSVRIKDSEGLTYVFPVNTTVKKIFLDRCKNVTVNVRCKIPTSTIEVYKCAGVDLDFIDPIGTIQADECAGPVRLHYSEYDHIGGIYHQNCPELAVGWGGSTSSATSDFQVIGASGAFQLSTKRSTDWKADDSGGKPLTTAPVRRGEGEFPVDLGKPTLDAFAENQPEPEQAPAPEELRRLAQERREKGNEMFRASDFMQAAAEYSSALQLDPTMDAVIANRAQCWLKLGDHQKALEDGTRCTEVNPKNPKGWFRKGMSLHAMKRYQEAIPALAEAEKLEPNNKQVTDAIKFAQLMCRKGAGAGY